MPIRLYWKKEFDINEFWKKYQYYFVRIRGKCMRKDRVIEEVLMSERLLYPWCLLVHVCLLIFFGYYKINILVYWNIFSVCIYTMGTFCIIMKKNVVSWIQIGYVEIMMHSILCNLVIGFGFGFGFYQLILIPVTFRILYYHNPRKISIRWAYIISVAGMLLMLLSSLVDFGHQKVEQIPERYVYSCFFINIFFCILVLITMSAELYSITYNREMTLIKTNQELSHRVSYDYVSKTLNRVGFYENVARVLQANPDKKYLMLCSDILDFKFVNDLFGEKAGDQVLRAQADLILKYMTGNSVLGRISSDKFALLIPSERFSPMFFAEKIQEMKTMFSTRNFYLHIYVGIYRIDDIHEPVGQMCDKAFLAIQKIKGNLHKVFAYYDQGILQEELEKRQLISEFDEALEKKQFEIYLQPQVNADGKVFGAEALIRWNHPERGYIMPGQFIEYFEKSGIIYKLDVFVWHEAAKLLSEWKKAGKAEYYISVNISALDFYYINVYQTFTEIVEQYGIDRKKLHIEITETIFSDKEETQQAICKLYEAGFVIEIDDFGSGYSSLRFLKDVCADAVKIDREFLKESSNAARGKSILSSIIHLINEIGMRVIVEGIEMKEQIDYLSDIGCECYQGFYFSKPMPVREFENKYNIVTNS